MRVRSALSPISHPHPAVFLFFSFPIQDLDKEEDVPLKEVDYNILAAYHKQEAENKKEREEIKSQILYEQKGFCREGGEGDGY